MVLKNIIIRRTKSCQIGRYHAIVAPNLPYAVLTKCIPKKKMYAKKYNTNVCSLPFPQNDYDLRALQCRQIILILRWLQMMLPVNHGGVRTLCILVSFFNKGRKQYCSSVFLLKVLTRIYNTKALKRVTQIKFFLMLKLQPRH